MPEQISRRESLKRGLAVSSLFALADLATPALAEGETDIPFTDYPASYNPNGNPNAAAHLLDIRKIDGMITPVDQFFFTQHYNRPEIDPAAHRLKLTGLVNKPMELSLTDLKGMKTLELVNGYECSGNSARTFEGLSSCGRFTGVRLRDVLKRAGVGDKAREVVFFGTDRKQEDVAFRQQTYKVEQQFGRSITLEHALKPEPILAWSLNGEPLKRDQGAPLRLIMPGWYGVCNVKWLSEIHLQEDRYLGNFQARWYRTLRGVGGTGEENDPNTQWVETEVTRMNLKSAIARVRKNAAGYQVFGFALNDGTPLKSVEVSVDGGPWQTATLDKANTQFSWKLFTFDWKDAKPGDHTLVSRATDANGTVQPTAEALKRKKTFLEDNAQFPRKIKIA
ncbi:MAG TPA: molybdopterin-dependent oxidoreductase [Bryobacteraceae bacterium]|jgi:DMSO/TMAO reductase YedYZ molybdopterin-dependent catalytic subunit|nr:molybdopterin-dependent oxidoreductase [Bryobacteraceae bacterium]